MLIFLYRLLFLPGLLIGLPYYAWRMWRRGGYRKSFGNRFGLLGNVPPKRNRVKRIWIQAVSVGELNAIRPLLERLHEEPNVEVVLTTTTSTGLRLLEQRLAPLAVWYGIFPLDFWPFSYRTWRLLRPDLSILMEGELWPEHLHQGHQRNVPVLLINARLSDRSFHRHMKLRGLARPFFRSLSAILAGSESDLRRFRGLGWINRERVLLTGNLKFDVPETKPVTPEERARMLTEFGFQGDGIRILLGSSTWPGEEAALLEIYQALRDDFPDLRLMIVPRHAERRSELETLFHSCGLRSHFRSKEKQAPEGTELYIADTTGELQMLSRFADLIFIGKSLPPNAGGQTPVEAAALGKAIIYGPDMSNFRDISRRLNRTGAAHQVDSTDSLERKIRELLSDDALRGETGRKAGECIAASRGATERTVREILKFL